MQPGGPTSPPSMRNAAAHRSGHPRHVEDVEGNRRRKTKERVLMCKPEWRRARIQAQRLADLARLRRVRDRIDREYAQPLDVEALARDVGVSAGHLSRQFRAAYGE